MTKSQIAINSAIKRLLRTVIPQIPAIISYLSGWKPEYSAIFSLAGAIVTALDKFLREMKVKWYVDIFGSPE